MRETGAEDGFHPRGKIGAASIPGWTGSRAMQLGGTLFVPSHSVAQKLLQPTTYSLSFATLRSNFDSTERQR